MSNRGKSIDSIEYLEKFYLLDKSGKYLEAYNVLSRYLQKNHPSASILYNFALINEKLGNLIEAEHYYKKSLNIDDQLGSYIGLASVWEKQNRIEEANQLIFPLLKRFPEHSGLIAMFSKLTEINGDPEKGLNLLINCFKKEPSDVIRNNLLFRMATLFHETQQYNKAFITVKKANLLLEKRFDVPLFAEFISRVKKEFELSKQTIPVSGKYSERPVFIVGLPRCGSSLLEQLLNAHKDIGIAGEWSGIQFILNQFETEYSRSYPECLKHVTLLNMSYQAKYYLNSLREYSVKSRYIVNKFLNNYLYLGFITKLLPNAKIIHCQRNPLDQIVSLYFQKFIEGSHLYSYHLVNIAKVYLLYQDLMNFWKENSPVPLIEIQYERLVNRTDEVMHKLFKFLKVPEDDSYKMIDNTSNFSNTISYSQIRKPIHSTSIGKARHYDSYLTEVKNILLL